jgi:hypothetical protein
VGSGRVDRVVVAISAWTVAAVLLGSTGVGGVDAATTGAPRRRADAVADPAFRTIWVYADDLAAAIPFARDHGLAINWIFTASTTPPWDLLHQAEAEGVRVNPAPALDPAPNPFFSTARTASGTSQVLDVLDHWAAKGLAPTTVVIDMEGDDPFGMQTRLALLGVEPDPAKAQAEATRLLRAAPSSAAFDEAKARWAQFVDDAHARGWRAAVTLIPLALDGAEDGDSTFARVADIPYQDADWDFGTVQAYRSIVNGALDIFGYPATTSRLVYEYGRDVQRRFRSGGLDVGLTVVGEGTSPPDFPYRSFDEWGQDLEAAAAAGLPPERIQPFMFRLMSIGDDPAQWILPRLAEPRVPPPDPATDRFRGAFRHTAQLLAELAAEQQPTTTTTTSPPATTTPTTTPASNAPSASSTTSTTFDEAPPAVPVAASVALTG